MTRLLLDSRSAASPMPWMERKMTFFGEKRATIIVLVKVRMVIVMKVMVIQNNNALFQNVASDKFSNQQLVI